MLCHWAYTVCCLFGVTFAEAISLSSTGNISFHNFAENVISNVFVRQKRQSTCDSYSKDEVHCTINVKKLGYDHALILNSTDHTRFVYPNENGTITLKQHQTVFLSCPGPNNTFKIVSTPLSSSNFTCLCGAYFHARKTVYDFDRLACSQPPRHEIVDRGFYGRESEFRRFEIGFRTDAQARFLKLVDVHYNRASTSTMYTAATVSRFIAGRQKLAKQQRYDQTHCCERQRNRLDMDAIYNAKSQDRSFAAQLYCHDSEFRTRCSYLSTSSAVVFKPAQLTPRSSFVYTASGSATFAYLNTAPQWRPIGDGNWLRIEEHVVEMARRLGKDLLVYTGVHDRLRLRDTGDDDGEREKMMFLYAAASGDKSIAIPLYFWKLVHEPESGRGVVYVTVNDLHVEEGKDYHLCERPMFGGETTTPRQWSPRNSDKGYSYACEVGDFLRSSGIVINDFVPSMATGLLCLRRNVMDDDEDYGLTNDMQLGRSGVDAESR